MKKLMLLLVVCACVASILAGCTSKYDEADFIGKTSAEIVEEYGDFDCVTMPRRNGLYRNCLCGYTIEEAKPGFFGMSEEVLFFIIFDENGIAISCEEGYRPGG